MSFFRLACMRPRLHWFCLELEICTIHCEDRHTAEPKSSVVGISESRGADGREVEVVVDEFHDQEADAKRCWVAASSALVLPSRVVNQA